MAAIVFFFNLNYSLKSETVDVFKDEKNSSICTINQRACKGTLWTDIGSIYTTQLIEQYYFSNK